MNAVALLTNGNIQIHDLATQKLVQEFPVNIYASMPEGLLNSKTGTLIPSIERRQRLQLVQYQLSLPESGEDFIPEPPSKTRSKPHRPTFTRSRISLQCNNSIHGLTVKSRIAQAEEFIALHRLDDCKALLDRRPSSSSGPPDPEDVSRSPSIC